MIELPAPGTIELLRFGGPEKYNAPRPKGLAEPRSVADNSRAGYFGQEVGRDLVFAHAGETFSRGLGDNPFFLRIG